MARSQWGSKLGFILASAGSAIGLGAIWKFPYVAGKEGGGAFLILYLAISLTIGLVLMTAEMAIGRAGKASPMTAFRNLGGRAWSLVGLIGVLVSFLILSFYSVVGGWTVAYIVKSVIGVVGTSVDPGVNADIFTQFITDSKEPIGYHLVFALLTLLTVIGGVQSGIEKVSKYLMPLLFVLMIGLIVRSLTLDNAVSGLMFFLKPDFTKITSETILEALGLSFFSLSLGLGIMVTYGSYVEKGSNLISSSGLVIVMTLATSFMAGLMVLPAVFAFGFEPGAGPGLTFITMPAVFAKMYGGYFFGVAFFVLLLVAALTSSMSLLEVLVSFLMDEFEISRVRAGVIAFSGFFALGIVCSLSLGVWSGPEYQLFGNNIFDALDKLTQNYLMTLGELALALFAAWAVWSKSLQYEFNQVLGVNALNSWRYFLGIVVPVVILAIFVFNVF